MTQAVSIALNLLYVKLFYNDVAVLGLKTSKRKIVKAFGDYKFQEMLEDASKSYGL